jgi:phytoene dehydrogenase-like protein
VSAYSDAVIALSPSAYWRMGDSSGTTMAAAVGPSGSYFNTPTLAEAGALTGDSDTAVRFTAAQSEYASVANNTALDLGNTFTIVAWVKRADALDLQTIVTKGDDAYALQFEFSNKPTLTRPGVAHIVSTADPIDDTNWHMIAVTKSGATARMFVDGVEDTVPQGSSTLTNNTNALEIGRWHGGGSGQLNGTLDEIALFKTALTPTQIADLYTAGTTAAGAPVSVLLLGGM